jgi:hypothetical protein
MAWLSRAKTATATQQTAVSSMSRISPAKPHAPLSLTQPCELAATLCCLHEVVMYVYYLFGSAVKLASQEWLGQPKLPKVMA